MAAPTIPAPGRGAPPHAFDEGVLALPFFDDRHVHFARGIGAWCFERTELWAEADRLAPAEAGARILRELGRDGWLGFLDPFAAPSVSGPADPGDFRSLSLAREALAYAHDLADFAYSIQALSACPLLLHGSEEQKKRYLPEMAAGTLSGAFAVSEQECGSDAASVALAARAVPGGYVLDGGKAWIANGVGADLFCVIARTGEGPGALGLTAFLVPGDTPGLGREPVDLIAPRSMAHLSFEGCRVPADAVLGRPGTGFVVAMDVLDRFRLTVGAAALGFARRAGDAALTRARTRRIYGATLFDLPTVRQDLAEIEVELNAAALLVARAAWELDRGSRGFAKHSAIAKLHATEAAQRVVDAGVQVCGAAGLVAGSTTERLYRQIRSLRLYEGASEVQKTVIAGSLSRRPTREL